MATCFFTAACGSSLLNGAPVLELIASRIGVTFELGLLAILISILISLPIGIYAAMRQDTLGDYFGRSVAIIFIAVPSFWIGTLIMIYPSIWWGWSPSLEVIPFTQDPRRQSEDIPHPVFHTGHGHGRNDHENDPYHDA